MTRLIGVAGFETIGEHECAGYRVEEVVRRGEDVPSDKFEAEKFLVALGEHLSGRGDVLPARWATVRGEEDAADRQAHEERPRRCRMESHTAAYCDPATSVIKSFNKITILAG